MEFEWDEKKAAKNLRKHGIRFDVAIEVFADIGRIELPDLDSSEDEQRWIAVGLINGVEIHVVFTMRAETVRLISARRANLNERKEYWNSQV